MNKFRFAVIAVMCFVGVSLANAQYTNPSNPTYGANKMGQCYNVTLNNWLNVLPTTADYAAFANQCDQYGNLTTPVYPGNLIPSATASFSLGSPSVIWSNLYVGYITATSSGNTISATTTVTAASPGAIRTVTGSITTSNASYANGSNSIVGVRGAATVPSGTTATTGYIYGAQGKVIVQGTLNGGALWVSGLTGQLDMSAGTLTGGAHLTPIWSDAGATGPSVSCTFCDSLVLTNTTSTTFHSLIFGYSKAAYFADLTDNGGGYISAGSGASAAVNGYLKVRVTLNGTATDAYIRVYAGAS
jgi:hypothetical protein